MNKFYRVIWNISLGIWIAVAETTRARGKRNGTVKRAAATILSLIAVPVLAAPPGTPSVTVATGYNNANAYAASNGATVVNISTPNSAGLSSNYYQQYNVNSHGLVLNNNDTSTISAQSQLAGKLYSNTNLTTPASVILNQVVSNNRSNIAGFTEVAGTKADVIVANPYGITCSGCGFLNTDRVTLTTGVPFLNSAGALAGFNVQQGNILVNGSGLNASGQQILDLVTRAVELQAPINVPDLGITTGTNQWSYITRNVTGTTAGVGTAPSYAIDSSALGGMYANRIRLIATENGVGVRLLGNAAAATGDFVLTSAGTITLQNQISAKQNITITSTDTSAQSATETDSSLTAGQDLSLTSSGGVTLNGGALVASQNLGVTANSLVDNADNAALANNNQRAAGKALTLNVNNAASIDGATWQASAGDLQGNVGHLTIGANGGHFKSSDNLNLTSNSDLALGAANFSSAKDLNLIAGGVLSSNGGQLFSSNNLSINSVGDLDLGTSHVSGGANTTLTTKGAMNIAGAPNEVVEALAGAVSITAGNGLTNAGSISANAGTATFNVNGTLSNSGKIQSLGNLTIVDTSNNGSEVVNNSGSILTTGALNLHGTAVSNTASGSVQANQGSTLQASSLTNAGQWLLSTQTGAADIVTVSGALTNSGTLQSAHDITLISQSVDNQKNLLAAGNLTATVASIFNNASNATTQAGSTLTLAGANTSLTNSGNLQATNVNLTTANGLTNSGTINGGSTSNAGTLTIHSGANLGNSGTIQSTGALNIDMNGVGADQISNSGTILTTDALTLTGTSVDNTSTGIVQANKGSTLHASRLTNAGQWLLSKQTGAADTVLVSGALTNSGTLQSARDLNLTVQSLDNKSNLLAAGNLTATVASTFNNETNAIAQSGSTLTLQGANTSLTNSGTLQATTVNLTTAAGITNSGTMSGGSSSNAGTLTIHSGANLGNSGTIQSTGALNIDMNGVGTDQVTNSGTIFTTDTLTLTGTAVSNTSTGAVQANQGSTLQANSLTNAGQWLLSTQTGTVDTVTVSGALINSGTLQSFRDLNLTAQSLDNQLNLVSQGNLAATIASTVNNKANAIMQSGSTLTLQGTNTTLTNDGSIQATALNLTTTGGVTNSGLLSGGSSSVVGTLDINSGNNLNNTGVIQSSSTLNINMNVGAGAGAITNNGSMFAGTSLILTGASVSNINAGSSTAKIASNGDMQLNLFGSDLITNEGLIQSGGALSSNAQSAGLMNTNTGVLHSNALNLNLDRIYNYGVIQSDSTSNNIRVSSLNNYTSGTLTFGSSGSGINVITAMVLTNNGLLQSYADLNLKIGQSLLDTGTIAANTDLNINNQGNVYGSTTYTLSVNCTNNCSSSALSGANNVTINNASSIDVGVGNTIAGGNITLGSSGTPVSTLTLESNSTAGSGVAATGNLNIYANTVNMNGSNTRFLANTSLTSGGAFNFNINGLLTNNGMIFSGDALNLTALGVTNTSTGGILALGNLTLGAGGWNLINNASGQLYAGKDLTIQNVASLYNYGNSSTNAGSIYAPNGNISITASSIRNQSQIEAGKNITLNAQSIDNTLPSTVSITTSGKQNDKTTATLGTSATAPNSAVGGCTGCTLNADGLGDAAWTNFYTETYTTTDSYTNGKPSFLPQIISNNAGTITLQNFTNASNYGGVISGGAVNIIGNSNSTFSNDSLSLIQNDYQQTWKDYVLYYILGPSVAYSNSHYQPQGPSITKVTTLDSIGGTIHASSTGTINVHVTNLLNNGATAPSITSTPSPISVPTITTGQAQTGATASGASGAILNQTTGLGSLNNVTSASQVSLRGGNRATVQTGTSFSQVATIMPLSPQAFAGLTGITITPPSNPNGYFVVNQSPNATYLIETNPLLGASSSYLGASYIVAQLGINPDLQMRLVGDNNYQAYLVQQELIARTGNQLLSGYSTLAKQMAGLTGNAVTESKSLGLVYGQAPTDAQLTNLKQDIVWMVATVVDGHQVLAPVVYLSTATKLGIVQGAIIQGGDVNMDVTTLANTGGTINGTHSLNIQAQGDIINTSGMIEGGNVSLNSTQGNIINQTFTQVNGSSENQATTVGKQAGIKSTGDLSMTAEKDITNLGANVRAGGNANLKAGGDVTFDTVQDKTSTTTHTSSSQGAISTTGKSTTTTTQQIGSDLTVGGNLNIQSGKDITIAGSNVRTGGNADLNAGHNVNIISRVNTTSTTTDTTSSGLGMNDSLYGSSTTHTQHDVGQSVGSTLNIGGNANITAKNDLTVQGSDVNVKGNGTINASNVNILAAENYDNTTTKTTTASVLGVSSNAPGVGNKPSSKGSATTSGSATAKGGDGLYQASASGSADAQGQGKGGLDLYSQTVTETTTTNTHHVGSNLNFGGNADINATNDVNLVGSKVNAKGNATVNATNVNVLAAEDKSTSTTTTTTDSVGLLANTKNNAGVGANANGSASGGIGRAPNVNGSADASASASTQNEVNFVEHNKTTNSSKDITHQGSAITSGGDLNISAKDDLNVAGSNLSAGKNANVNATNMNFTAVDDVHETSNSSDQTTFGMYADANASAKASANAAAGIGANSSAAASASANVGAGVHGTNNQSSHTQGSTTAKVSSITAGGDINRNATNSINDVGTNISADGDLNQNAQTITSQAAKNTTYSTDTTNNTDARIGVYAGAKASATGSAGLGGATSDVTPVKASAGINASVSHDQSTSSSNSSTAVVSNIHVGGSVKSDSMGTTTLEGTNISAGKDVNLGAGTLDIKAAKNTTDSKSVQGGGTIGGQVDVLNKKVTVSGSGSGSDSTSSSSTAVVSNIHAGHNLNLISSGDTNLEGTNLSSVGATTVNTDGNLNYSAAQNTSSSTTHSADANLSVTVGKGSAGGTGGVNYSQQKSNSSQDVVGNVTSGGPITVNTGGNSTFTGTNLSSSGDVNVSTGGNLSFDAAHNKQTSTGGGFSASGGGGDKTTATTETSGTSTTKTNTREKSGYANADINYNNTKSDQATGGTINSGGNIQLSSGKNTSFEGTQVKATDHTNVSAGGSVTQNAAVSTSSNAGFDLSGGGGGSTKTGTSTTKQGISRFGGNIDEKQKNGGGVLDFTDKNSSSSQNTSITGGQGVTITPNTPQTPPTAP